ncbi:MAG: arylesterase [Candidatus Rokuibacteriota bacterium]|nr:MAG: arylesterase [Candidatus Rokubacteria bacterium]
MGLLRALLVSVLVASAASATPRADHVVVALGDSLTAGLGVGVEEAYPALLEARLRREGFDYRVVNAGVSGDTSAGGLRRLDWALKLKPQVLIVALGANDGLRGQPPAALRANLTQIVERARGAGARVLLAGMRVPPNYGDEYARAFAAVYTSVARATGVPLAPFLLDGVAGDPRLNQADGIHPTAEGQRVIAEHLWPHLRPLLAK